MALAWDIPHSSNVGLTLMFWCGLVFWSCDIAANLNTAIYARGRLVRDRAAIALSYLSTWAIFDVSLVTLDLANAFAADTISAAAAFRLARVIRAFRLLRLLKIARLQTVVQELAASTGRQWLMLVIAIINTTFVLLVVAHMLTCIWVWLGRSTQSEGRESWIDIAGAATLSIPLQYLHSLRYVMNSPSPPTIAPDNGQERLFDILTYWPADCTRDHGTIRCPQNMASSRVHFNAGSGGASLKRSCPVSVTTVLTSCIRIRFSILVMGTTISTIAGSLHDLRAMNEARARQRREVRLYLTGWRKGLNAAHIPLVR